jgi:serine/threonine protein kinase
MQESVIQWPLGLDGNDLAGAGVTAIVARLDAVVKFFKPSESRFFEREKLIYQRLGRDHSGIVRYYGALENALILQFASQTSIRQYVARQKQAPLSLRLRWVEQLFDAVGFIHSRSVLHGDISCNNIFLDDNLDVKLGDFAGSAIDDLPPLVCYETSHELPGEDTSTRTELFALGSTVYEIMTGLKPYKDLPDHEVSAAFSKGHYPDLESVPALKNTIMGCWRQSYATAEEALRDIKLEGTFSSSFKLQKLIICPVATIKEPRISRFYTLLSHQKGLFPFFLTAVSLVSFVGWARRWRSLQ